MSKSLITSFDKSNARALHLAMIDALAGVAKEFGVKFSQHGGSVQPTKTVFNIGAILAPTKANAKASKKPTIADTDDADEQPKKRGTGRKPMTAKQKQAFAEKMKAAREAAAKGKKAVGRTAKRTGKKSEFNTLAGVDQLVRGNARNAAALTRAEKKAKAERAAKRAERKAKREAAAKREARANRRTAKVAKPARSARTTSRKVVKAPAKAKRRNRMG